MLASNTCVIVFNLTTVKEELLMLTRLSLLNTLAFMFPLPFSQFNERPAYCWVLVSALNENFTSILHNVFIGVIFKSVVVQDKVQQVAEHSYKHEAKCNRCFKPVIFTLHMNKWENTWKKGLYSLLDMYKHM